jgi:hypothetical protein
LSAGSKRERLFVPVLWRTMRNNHPIAMKRQRRGHYQETELSFRGRRGVAPEEKSVWVPPTIVQQRSIFFDTFEVHVVSLDIG